MSDCDCEESAMMSDSAVNLGDAFVYALSWPKPL